MSEQPYPSLPASSLLAQDLVLQRSQRSFVLDVPQIQSQSQGPQSPRTTPDHLVFALPLPALFHRDGRIVHVNKDLCQVLGLSSGISLTGVPCDSVLAHADESVSNGTAVRVLIRTEHGPVPAELWCTNISLSEATGAIWTFTIASEPNQELTAQQAFINDAVADVTDVIAEMEDLYQHIWEDDEDLQLETVSDRVQRALQSANSGLDRLHAALCNSSHCDASEALERSVEAAKQRLSDPKIRLEVRPLPLVRAAKRPLQSALSTLLICAARRPDSTVHVTAGTDIAGFATIDIRVHGGRLDAQDIGLCRPLLQRIGATLLDLSPHHVRVRMAPGVPSRTRRFDNVE